MHAVVAFSKIDASLDSTEKAEASNSLSILAISSLLAIVPLPPLQSSIRGPIDCRQHTDKKKTLGFFFASPASRSSIPCLIGFISLFDVLVMVLHSSQSVPSPVRLYVSRFRFSSSMNAPILLVNHTGCPIDFMNFLEMHSSKSSAI